MGRLARDNFTIPSPKLTSAGRSLIEDKYASASEILSLIQESPLDGSAVVVSGGERSVFKERPACTAFVAFRPDVGC
jgi:hypothetical protein